MTLNLKGRQKWDMSQVEMLYSWFDLLVDGPITLDIITMMSSKVKSVGGPRRHNLVRGKP